MLLVACLFLFAQAHGNTLQVNTTEGVVVGGQADNGKYYAFHGIPYAGSTTGQNRFKAPLPPPKRKAPFDATAAGTLNTFAGNVICAHPTSRGLIGTEDCLTLSIFTKNVTTPKPVIVFLNSEEYTTTTQKPYSYKRIVDENLVFVTVNYRLSIFGFLCLGVPEAPGNAGLKDVIQALKWINANIANFGGNSSNVVLMGHGSGAAMVDILTMSPRTTNLVHKAIALSGSALAPWAIAYDPIGYARAVASIVGYSHKTNSQLAKHLVTTDINVLIPSIKDIQFTNNTPLFAPCLENPKLNPNDTVISVAPVELLQSGKYNDIPYITGYTTREGTMRAREGAFGQWLEGMQANFSNFLQVDLNFGNNKTAVAQVIREFYFSKRQIDMGTIEDYLDYEGDILVLVSVIRGAKERGLTSKSEVRLLEFGYMGTLNSDWTLSQIHLNGVMHGGLLNYLFDYDLKPADKAVMTSVVKRLAGFAYTGKPNALTGARGTVAWPAVTKDTLNYLYYGGQSSFNPITAEEAKFNPNMQRMTFWNNLYMKYYVPPQAINSAVTTFNVISLLILSQLFIRFF